MCPKEVTPRLGLIAEGNSAISGDGLPAAEVYKRGRAFFEKGKFKEALNEFEKVLKKDPKCLPALRYKGLTLFKLERFKEAYPVLNLVLLLNPDDPYAYHNLGVALASLEKFGEARVLLKKALRKKQDDIRLWDTYSLLLLLSEEFEDAVGIFDKMLETDPKNASAWNNKGLALLYSRKDTYYRHPASSFFYIIKLHSIDADTGLVKAGRDNVKRAIACFDKALAIEPKNPEPLFNKARALSALAIGFTKLDESCFGVALESLDRALALNPHDSEMLAYKGVLIYMAESASALRPLNLGRISVATTSLEKSADGTDNVFLLFEVGRFLSDVGWLTGRFESNFKPTMRAYRSAYAVFDKILELKPGDRALLRATRKEQDKVMNEMKRWGDRDDEY